MTDEVNHPRHYTSHACGVECIDVVEHLNFNLGNVIKYIWRAGEKGDLITDLQKAEWYLKREISRCRRLQLLAKPGEKPKNASEPHS